MARKPDPHSVFDEPHLRPHTSWRADEREAHVAQRLRLDRLSCDPEDELAEHSVWDEPTQPLATASGHAPPADALTYGRWMVARRATSPAWQSWFVTACVALVAGPFAVLGALMGQAPAELSIGLMAYIFAAPLVEEILKMSGASIVLERRPFLFRHPAQLLLCTGLSGLIFACIENVLYLRLYVESPSASLIFWRWTVCVALHTCCSLIAGMGLVRVWREAWAQERRPDISRGAPFFTAAIALHGLYNLSAVLLELLWKPF